jgi:hypothetical protein
MMGTASSFQGQWNEIRKPRELAKWVANQKQHVIRNENRNDNFIAFQSSAESTQRNESSSEYENTISN